MELKKLPSALIRYSPLLLVIFLAIAGGISACGGQTKPTVKHSFNMASLSDMPAEVKAAPVVVQEAYQFAAANPEVLQHIPCYCGCGDMGHTSNYACYISEQEADGKLAYDEHALGCSICVDITQDAMRLLDEGKDLATIRSYIDQTYAKYGPTNMP